jgi:hypothetical protein
MVAPAPMQSFSRSGRRLNFMKTDWTEINRHRITKGPLASTENIGRNGAFKMQRGKFTLYAVATDGADANEPGEEFEHVSVHADSWKGGMRCPTWEEMCWIKDLFWEPNEVVIQYHPAEKDYVNTHPHTLHLWKPLGVELPRPSKLCV